MRQEKGTEGKTGPRLSQIPSPTCLLPVGLSLEVIVGNGAVGEFKQDYPLLSEFEAGTTESGLSKRSRGVFQS